MAAVKKSAPARKSRAGRPPVVENHPKRDEILRSVLVPKPNFSCISRTFGISIDALRTFRKANITEPTRRALDEIAQVQSELPVATLDVVAKLDLLVDRGYRMLAACDEWLTDPDAPGRYNLNPRTHEVDVVYEREVVGTNGTRTERRTEKLGKLLRDVEDGLGITVVKGETKTADPRKLLLDAVATLKPVVELIGKATGQIKQDPKVEIHLHPEVVDLRTRLTEWLLARHPADVEELARLFESGTEA